VVGWPASEVKVVADVFYRAPVHVVVEGGEVTRVVVIDVEAVLDDYQAAR
jgi:hypothetical protein